MYVDVGQETVSFPRIEITSFIKSRVLLPLLSISSRCIPTLDSKYDLGQKTFTVVRNESPG